MLDGIAELACADDFDAIRDRYRSDDRVRVPREITSLVDGNAVTVHLEL